MKKLLLTFIFSFFIIFLFFSNTNVYACFNDNVQRGCFENKDCCNTSSTCQDITIDTGGTCVPPGGSVGGSGTNPFSWGPWGSTPAGPSLNNFFNLLGTNAPPNASKASWESVLSTIISLFFLAAFVLALFYIIWGGFNWIFSGGDKQRLAKAREHVIYAIVGLVIVFLAATIISALGAFFKINFLNLP